MGTPRQGCNVNVEVPTATLEPSGGNGHGEKHGGNSGSDDDGGIWVVHGREPLLATAATATSESLMAMLLEEPLGRPADVNYGGGEVLRRCAERGMVTAVRTLLRRGADPNARDCLGRSALSRTLRAVDALWRDEETSSHVEGERAAGPTVRPGPPHSPSLFTCPPSFRLQASRAERSQDTGERLAAEVTRAMPAPPPLPAAEVMTEGGGGGGGAVAATAAYAVTAACVAPTAKRLCAVARLLLMAGATVEEDEESTRTVRGSSQPTTLTQGPRPHGTSLRVA
jgi:hypothetical protein